MQNYLSRIISFWAIQAFLLVQIINAKVAQTETNF